jgi:hypothetical protein
MRMKIRLEGGEFPHASDNARTQLYVRGPRLPDKRQSANLPAKFGE